MRLPMPAMVCLMLAWPAVSTHAGHRPSPGWPEVTTPFFHATTPAQAGQRTAYWLSQAGCTVQGYTDTGSMRPVLSGGRELLAMEHCHSGTPLAPGQIVRFNRGETRFVLHYIAAISRDGTQVYLSGVNNRHSDGWLARTRISAVVREIITLRASSPRI